MFNSRNHVWKLFAPTCAILTRVTGIICKFYESNLMCAASLWRAGGCEINTWPQRAHQLLRRIAALTCMIAPSLSTTNTRATHKMPISTTITFMMVLAANSDSGRLPQQGRTKSCRMTPDMEFSIVDIELKFEFLHVSSCGSQ
jgi:hypothetical protein